MFTKSSSQENVTINLYFSHTEKIEFHNYENMYNYKDLFKMVVHKKETILFLKWNDNFQP